MSRIPRAPGAPIIRATLWVAVHAAACFGCPASGLAHCVVGQRFFPATIAIDDPCVADELALPTVTSQRLHGEEPGDPNVREREFSMEYAKTITKRFAVGFEFGGKHVDPDGAPSGSGLNNLGVSLKYQFYESEPHEAAFSIGVDTDIGGTGFEPGEADRFTTFAPTLFFGKGLGDLPDELAYVRPFAITGQAGLAIPTSASRKTVTVTQTVDPDTGDVDVDTDVDEEKHPAHLKLGFSVQYSLPYLQESVRDIGIPYPLSRFIPLVEFDLDKPINRGGGKWTGTINPGLIWVGDSFQIGAEAIVPINDASGQGTGFRAQLHFYLDDLFPSTLGKPLFGS